MKISYARKVKHTPIRHCCGITKLDDLLNKNTIFPHPYGIVISEYAHIGKNCVIYQNVTIGTDKFEHGCIEKYYPTIGNNVIIYANAVVVGNITIGDNAIIAAGSVVLKDVPAKS